MGTRNGRIFANGYELDARSLQSRSWADDELIGDDNGGVSNPQIGIDLIGNAIVVWTQNGDIYGARYEVAKKEWSRGSHQLSVGTSALENASKPSLGVSRSGTAILVWLETGGEKSAIVDRAYDGSNWNDPVALVSGSQCRKVISAVLEPTSSIGGSYSV